MYIVNRDKAWTEADIFTRFWESGEKNKQHVRGYKRNTFQMFMFDMFLCRSRLKGESKRTTSTLTVIHSISPVFVPPDIPPHKYLLLVLTVHAHARTARTHTRRQLTYVYERQLLLLLLCCSRGCRRARRAKWPVEASRCWAVHGDF